MFLKFTEESYLYTSSVGMSNSIFKGEVIIYLFTGDLKVKIKD